MGNRKQPFGYKMALGEIVIQEAEARLVQGIFRRYIAGESLNELTEALRQQDIPYDEGRLWNKNMVARILADIRYTGEKGYPKLIDEEQLIAANEKRSNKPQLPKKTEAQKVLRRLCGTPPSEQVEQSVTYLLNGLANYPDRIQHRRSPTPVTYSKTQEALDNTLEQQPIDEDSAKGLILQLAAEQYAALGNEEYETNRLRRLFSAFECVAELNADLLKNTVSEVLVTRQNVKLRLKNGQIIQISHIPSLWNFAFELDIPNHFAAGGLVGPSVLVREVELHEPIVINCLRQGLQFGDLLAVQLNLFIQRESFFLYSAIASSTLI